MMTAPPPASLPSPPPFWDRLTVRQVMVTAFLACLSASLAGVFGLAAGWRAERNHIDASITQELTLVRGAASTAAFQLSPSLADEVSAGLMERTDIADTVLADNFGGTLSRRHRVQEPFVFPWLSDWAFGDMARHNITLSTAGADGRETQVGSLSVILDPGIMTADFLAHFREDLSISMASVALLSIVMAGVFHRLMARPILMLARTVGAIDLHNPAAHPSLDIVGHRRDEIGVFAAALHHLLRQFQVSLDNHARAQARMAALADGIQHTVADRTAELERGQRKLIADIRRTARLQPALLPLGGTPVEAVGEFSLGYHPLDEVGGDFYWCGTLGDTSVIALMDCGGPGVSGALGSAMASFALGQAILREGPLDPGKILSALNQLVTEARRQDGDDDEAGSAENGIEAALCVLRAQDRKILFAASRLTLAANLGGQLRLFKGEPGGIGDGMPSEDDAFPVHAIHYQPGDSFFLCTDGITGQMGGSGGKRQPLGIERVADILASSGTLPLDEQRDRVFDYLTLWRGSEARRDDMTLIGFRPKD